MDDQIVLRKDTHNHPPDEAETEVEKIVDSLKEKVRTTAQPIPAVYSEEIQAVACRSDRDEIVAKLPTFSSLKTSLYRQRKSCLPPLPRADVHFDDKKLVNTIVITHTIDRALCFKFLAFNFCCNAWLQTKIIHSDGENFMIYSIHKINCLRQEHQDMISLL